MNKNDIDAIKISKSKKVKNDDKSKSEESRENDYIFLTDEIKKNYSIEICEDIDEEEIYRIVYGGGETSGNSDNDTEIITHCNNKNNAICEKIIKMLNNYHGTDPEVAENNINIIELFELIDDYNHDCKTKRKLPKQKPRVNRIKVKKKIMSKSNNKSLATRRKRGRYRKKNNIIVL